MVNVIDKAIAFWAPGMGARRIVARQKFALAARAYEGASKGVRVSGWRTTTQTHDAEVGASAKILRERSRDLVDNNKYVIAGVSGHIDNFVGEGIVPRAMTESEDRNKVINEAFDRWVDNSDPAGQLNWYGQQAQAGTGMVEAGETFGRKLITKRTQEDLVPLQIQNLDPEFVDEQKNEAKKAGSNIVNGIEFDGNGRRKGYWLFAQHPADSRSGFGGNNSKLIKAEDMVHLYEPRRVQARGIPWTTPIIIDSRDFRDWEQAENVRKKTEACNVGVIEVADDVAVGDNSSAELGVGIFDQSGNPAARMEPGHFYLAKGGTKISYNNPQVSGSHEPHARLSIRGIAAGLRIPYELVSRDYSNFSYASSRASMLAYRKFVRRVQRHLFIHQYCRPIWGWFLIYAQLMGIVKPDEYVPTIWTLPTFEHINPIDDIRADILAVRAGFKSLRQVIAERGENPDKVIAEWKANSVKLDELGLIFDSDPRHVNQQGMMQLLNEFKPENE